MACIIPDGWRELSVTGAVQREIETLAVLADGLPDDYAVYHAVHWTGMDGRYQLAGCEQDTWPISRQRIWFGDH